MALAPLSQTLVLTADSSNLNLTDLVEIPSGVIVTPVTISGTPGSATQGTSYSFVPATANGRGTKAFALTGTLPAGLVFSTTTGAITGTPTAAGTATGLNIKVTDSSGNASLGTFSLVVAAAPVTLKALTVSVSNATVGTAVSSTITGLTSGSSVALTGTGAAGLSISGAVINGTPTATGPVNIVETLSGATNSPRTTSRVITVVAPAPTPSNTYANSTQVYANNSSFSPDLVDVEQRLLALGGSYSQYAINYGTGPNTATGDSVNAALVKLQNWIAAIEADRAVTQDSTLAGNSSLLAGNAAWKARFQALETRFTALGVA